MSPDDLLLWMSARTEGTWAQFRTAIEELQLASQEGKELTEDGAARAQPSAGFPVQQHLRLNLERLAHAEFSTAGSRYEWRVVPPSLSVHRRAGEIYAVLCGARTPDMLDELKRGAAGLKSEIIAAQFAPAAMTFRGESEQQIDQLAERHHLIVQKDAPLALLLAIPPASATASSAADNLPLGDGWTIERFSSRQLAWQPSTRAETARPLDSLFRFTHGYRRCTFLMQNRRTTAVDVQSGKYLLLKGRRNVLKFDASAQELSCPLSCRPPLLAERALILCSGSLPAAELRNGSNTLVYRSIPLEIARTAAAALGQDLQ